jgi:cell division control protein 45
LVGLTDHFVHERIHLSTYVNSLVEYVEEVKQKNITSDDETKATKLEKHQMVTTAKQGHIQQSNEYRFILLNHWSIWESMTSSQYTFVRLYLWNSDGKTFHFQPNMCIYRTSFIQLD